MTNAQLYEQLRKSVAIAEQGPEAVNGFYVQARIDDLFNERRIAVAQIEELEAKKRRIDREIDRLEQGR